MFVFHSIIPKKSPAENKLSWKSQQDMGFESLHAAAAEGDDQELRKRVEGLDVDRLVPKFCDFLSCRFNKN